MGSGFAEREEGAYTAFTALRGPLLGEKASDFQREFLDAARTPEAFVDFMDEKVPREEGEVVATFNRPLTEQSFIEMTADQEQAAYTCWQDVPPRVACRVSFWAEVTIQHLRARVIRDAYWLAARRSESGEERIDRVLQMEGESGEREVDRCVRTILRRMSGLPSARANRSVFVNPSFGRAWWRERLVSRIAARDGSEGKTALSNVVRSSQQYWENLVMLIVSRGSVLGAVDVQDAFVNALAKHLSANSASPFWSAKRTEAVLRRFSNVAASRELGVLEFQEIGRIAEALIDQVAATEASGG